MKLCLLFIAGLLALAIPADAQTPAATLRLFLDCSGFRCDEQFYRSEIDWVNYVRDRQDSDVHLLITRQQTGGGGSQFTLEFLGQGALAAQQLELSYLSPQTATEDEEREGLARVMRLGLAALVAARSPGAAGLEVNYQAPDGATAAANGQIADDPWNFWTFNTRLGGSFRSEARRSSW